MSEAQKGRRHTEETKAKIRESLKGENNPMYGKVANNAVAVNLYNAKTHEFVTSFPSQKAAAKWLGVSQDTVSNAFGIRKCY